jgi:CRISPR/Cas system CSM-associated protein Csm2 small subunit
MSQQLEEDQIVKDLINLLTWQQQRLLPGCRTKRRRKESGLYNILKKMIDRITLTTSVPDKYKEIWDQLKSIVLHPLNDCKQIIISLVILIYIRDYCLSSASTENLSHAVEFQIKMLNMSKKNLLEVLAEEQDVETQNEIRQELDEISKELSDIENVDNSHQCQFDTIKHILSDILGGDPRNFEKIKKFIRFHLPDRGDIISLLDTWIR